MEKVSSLQSQTCKVKKFLEELNFQTNAFLSKLFTYKHKYEKSLSKLEKRSLYTLIHSYLFLEEGRYYEELQKKKYFDKVISDKKKIILLLSDFFENYYQIKYVSLDLIEHKIDKRTLNFYFKNLETLVEDLFLLYEVNEIISDTEIITKKKELLTTIKKIKMYFSLITNFITEIELNKKDLETSKLRSISYKKVRKGDIILERKSGKALTFRRKIISRGLHSQITHSVLVSHSNSSGVYIFEASGYNTGKNRISKLKRSEDIEYILLKPKRKLSRKQLFYFDKFIEENLGKSFSQIKLLAAAFERILARVFQDSPIPYSKKRNPLKFLRGVFCSELVAGAYREMGIEISPYEDLSLVSPIDILNSSDLEIRGVIRF